ncbi:nitroreductase [Candidatus Bathyarchaeota archaeon]|nr:MAG: nitroreductase [Candidatus Bathyarchaeota archaeon]
MDFFEVVKARRSIRRFKQGARVRPEDVRAMLEAARLAPSAKNLQPWYIVVVRDEARKEALAEAAMGQRFVAEADVVMVCLSDPARSPRWHDKDAMIALEHVALAATALGYGSCWIGAFDGEAVRRIVGAPEGLEVVAMMAVGVPDEAPPPRPRRPPDELFFSEEFGRPWGRVAAGGHKKPRSY